MALAHADLLFGWMKGPGEIVTVALRSPRSDCIDETKVKPIRAHDPLAEFIVAALQYPAYNHRIVYLIP
jgi:hypothetical protein